MGLIKAAMGAAGGVMADQWKEFFYCDALDQDTLMIKGQKRTGARSSNTKGSDNIISNGSRKMDDALMEAIEPYDFKDAVPFQTPYLAGYVADRYDVNMEECMGRATNRIRQSAEDALRETVKGYQTVTTTNRQINIMSAQYWYAMYPVWVLNTTWKGEKYTFAMNGQTGKMVGDLPADQGAFWKFVGLRGVILGAIIYAVMWIVTLI